MRITYSSEGGMTAAIPGLARPKVFDIADLPDQEANELIGLISQIDFFKLPSEIGSVKKGSADYSTQILTIEDNKLSHTVRLLEPITDPQLRALSEIIKKSLKSLKK